MNFKDLTPSVRAAMREEVDADIAAGQLYLSARLSEQGRSDYPDLLRHAVDRGTPEDLADELTLSDRLLKREMSHRKGKPYAKDVPHNAAQTAAEGEFNRFYCRGVCVVAIAEGNEVEVYRAKEVQVARTASKEMLERRQRFDPRALLDDLRSSIGVDTAFHLPDGPNSGLSITIVR